MSPQGLAGGKGDGLTESAVKEAVDRVLAALSPAVEAAVRGGHGNPDRRGTQKGGPRYALRRGYRAWDLVYDWEQVAVGDELAIRYVHHLMKVQPGTLIHGVELAALVQGHTVVQEGPGDDAPTATLRALGVEALEWKEVLDDPTSPESELAEALEQLKRLAQQRNLVRRRPPGGAGKCVAGVRRAMWRFQERLADACGEDGKPHRVLQGFAGHLKQYLIIPSSRYARGVNARQRAGVAGCFIYEPPEGMVWEG